LIVINAPSIGGPIDILVFGINVLRVPVPGLFVLIGVVLLETVKDLYDVNSCPRKASVTACVAPPDISLTAITKFSLFKYSKCVVKGIRNQLGVPMVVTICPSNTNVILFVDTHDVAVVKLWFGV
jgi:hypothetical protein